jgi:multidrug efflux system outer membrane protein
VAELDVARMQTEVAATEAEALALERQQAQLRWPCWWARWPAASAACRSGRAALPVIPAGVPATVLARRPDVSAAQASVLAAQARVGVAEAWFPAITLTGNGYASPELGDLFKWSARSWGIGALLSLPSSTAASARRRKRAPARGWSGHGRPPRPGADGLPRGGGPAQRLRLLEGQAEVLGRPCSRHAAPPSCRIRATATVW